MRDTDVVGHLRLRRNCGSFGDLTAALDMDYLASIQELEASSSQDFGVLPVAAEEEDGRRRDILARTKSEAALKLGAKAGGGYNPLLNLALEDALQTINDFLQSDTRCVFCLAAVALG